MKFIHLKKTLACGFMLLACSLISFGQEKEQNTSVSLGKQYLNNSVPGAKYGPAKVARRKAAAVAAEENHSESSGMQLKKGTMKGAQYAGGGNSSSTLRKSSAARVAKPAGASLSSDAPANADKKALKAIAAPVQAVPLQDGQQPQEKPAVLRKKEIAPAKQ